MTQLSQARSGVITEEMRQVAQAESLEPEAIRQSVAEGLVIIPHNVYHAFPAIGIGKGLRTKVNANIGASGFHQDLDEELEKLRVSLRSGADSVMDLSTGKDLDQIRKALLAQCPVIFGTVPIYEVACGGNIEELDPEDLFQVIEKQARQGVDFMTVHCGITQETVRHLRAHPRITGIVSRGGALLAAYIEHTGRENPLYEQFDRLCEIFYEHDVTFSLGDGLRPGGVSDATDRGQVAELLVLGELTERARKKGCQVMIEGPGHVPIDQIPANVQLEKRLCGGAPFYVLGPLVTDVAPGYDHITAAIGGAIAAASGVDFLCYVTPAEHLRLPTVEDVREGVIATRIAAHAGDLAKGIAGARDWDAEMSRRRKALDWNGMFELAIDPERAKRFRDQSEAAQEAVCTMCGKLCALKLDSETTPTL